MREKLDMGELRCYKDLATAVAILAVKDLKRAYRALARHRNAMTIRQVQELEEFFYSDWYRVLASVDGDETVRHLREKAGISEEDVYEHSMGLSGQAQRHSGCDKGL